MLFVRLYGELIMSCQDFRLVTPKLSHSYFARSVQIIMGVLYGGLTLIFYKNVMPSGEIV